MITDKQRQHDFEYEADYQTKSRYSSQQWENILNSGQISEEELSLLQQVYASYNHAANLLQLSFHANISEEDILSKFNATGQKLGEVNDFEAEVDYSGNEYWWYLFFWGKNLPDKVLELKMHPELTEAIGKIYPEMEQAYYAFMGSVDRSLQIRYSQEEAVWIAAATLLYEKYYRYPGISTDDILLMQYEVQTRAQKVFGQDVDTSTITQICNADERGHSFNYLRDLYKYYRVSFPGEFDHDRERPDPQDMDYSAYIYSLFGYMTLTDLADFIDHEYAHLVDDSYVELTNANGFVRAAEFLSRHAGSSCPKGDTSDPVIALRASGEDAEETFHMIAEALIKEYPNFVYAKKASWIDENEKTVSSFSDVLYIPNYAHTNASISVHSIVDNDALDLEIALNLPDAEDPEVMLDIKDKCSMLTLMTTAPFQVKEGPVEHYDLATSGGKLKAFAVYAYKDFMTMKEDDIIGLTATALQIFASYYTDICQNYYPDTPATMDAFAAALGDKLVIRERSDVPGPKVIYKEGTKASSTSFIENAIQGYGSTLSAYSKQAENTAASEAFASEVSEINIADSQPATESGSALTPDMSAAGTASLPINKATPVAYAPAAAVQIPASSPKSTNPGRNDQSFKLYPKNTLIQGAAKTAKFHEALLTAVGIIEGKEHDMIGIEPFSNVLESFKLYEEAEKILHISYPDLDGKGYEGWIEGFYNGVLLDGIFKRFANQCGEGRYVVLMEDVDLNWMHLFGETAVLLRDNRREGASSESVITLHNSKQTFTLPSNLYIVATCDSVVSEDTIIGAIHQDFFIRQIAPDANVLRGMRVEGIALDRLMSTINMRLSYFLDANYQLGEGFFLGTADKDPMISLGRVFREQIIPLLTMWLDGDMEKMRYVLGDNGKRRADAIFFKQTPFRSGLFKGSLPDSFDTEMSIYEINEAAFYNPRSYIEVYE